MNVLENIAMSLRRVAAGGCQDKVTKALVGTKKFACKVPVCLLSQPPGVANPLFFGSG